MDTSKTEEEIRKHFALFHIDPMVSRSLRFILVSFCFLGHVIGQGMTKETHAHDRYHNSRFYLFTRCQPMHLHVEVQVLVDDALAPNEKRRREIYKFVERRLRTARLYQETAQNYFYVHVIQLPNKNYNLTFDFRKMLYDQATDSWDYATTYGGNNPDLSTEHLTSTLSFFLDTFLEDYVEVNKAFCH